MKYQKPDPEFYDPECFTKTEVISQTVIDKLMKGRTTLMIEYRLSAIRNADIILVIK